MSDLQTHSVSYVRKEMVPEKAPPLTQVGLLRWLRENLFSSWLNAFLTIASLYIVYTVIADLLPWMLNGVWNAGSLTECRQSLASVGLASHDGACWAVIRDRWMQLLFGFYPSDQIWRPLLAFALFFVAMMPVLFPERSPRGLGWFTAIYPFLAVWLIWGGAYWTPILVALGFVIGFVVYRLASAVLGAGGATIVAILASLVWWLYGFGWANETIYRSVGESRIEQALIDVPEESEALEIEFQAIEASQEALEAEVAEAVALKDELLAQLEASEGEADPELQAAVAAQFAGISTLRDRQAVLSRENLRLSRALSANRTLLRGMDGLSDSEEELPLMREELLTLRAALPASVAQLMTLEGVAEGTPEEEIEALEAVLDLTEDVRRTENSITSTYRGIGLVGLRPIASTQIGGFTLGIIIGIASIVLSLPIGILLALGRQSDLFIINKFSVIFIEVIRGVPLIVWLFTASLLLNYFLPPGTNFDLMLRVIIMVTLFSAAYIAEVVRGGLAALPRGQYEAADALGLDYPRAMQLIVLPQALKISIPGIVNTFIGLFKDTTLVLFIGLLDPIGLASAIRADTAWNGIYWELFIFIGVIFFILCYSMGRYSLFLERKLQREHR